MKSFSKAKLENFTVTNELVRMVRRLGEYKGKQNLFKRQSPDVLKNLRQVAIVQSTESSNRLENITAEPNRFQEIMKHKSKPKNRNESEIAGYRDVLDTIHTSAGNIKISEKIIQQFHRDIMKYTGISGGKWKNKQNEIIEFLPNGTKRIRFKPIEPFLVNEYMIQLQCLYNEQISLQKIDPLFLIPIYILDFLCIHPFNDGNGRISRLITLLLLYHQGYEVGRYISIEKIIEKTKESYYETLEISSREWHTGKHDPIPWITYFFSTLLAAYDEFERRAGIIIKGKGTKTEMVINAIDAHIGEFSVSDLKKNCPLVSIDMIRYVMKKLKSDGKIEIVKLGRNAKWRKTN